MDNTIVGVAIRHLQLFRTRLASLSREDQFRKIATMFIGSSYKMGSENFNECDCSGLVSSSLRGMGYAIRLNANDLITTGCNEGWDSKSNSVGIVGCFDKKVNKYSHIGILFHSPSTTTVLHASYPTGCAFEHLPNFVERYEKRDHIVSYHTLDFSKIEKLDGKVFGLDEDFK